MVLQGIEVVRLGELSPNYPVKMAGKASGCIIMGQRFHALTRLPRSFSPGIENR